MMMFEHTFMYTAWKKQLVMDWVESQRVNFSITVSESFSCYIKHERKHRAQMDVLTLIIYLYHVITSRVAKVLATPQPHVAELLPNWGSNN